MRVTLILSIVAFPALASTNAVTWEPSIEDTAGRPLTKPVTYEVYEGGVRIQRGITNIRTTLTNKQCGDFPLWIVAVHDGHTSAPSELVTNIVPCPEAPGSPWK